VAFAVESVAGVVSVAVLDQDTLQWVSADVLPHAGAAPATLEVLGNFGDRPVFVPLSTSEPILTQSANRSAGDNTSTAWTLSITTAHCRPFGLLGRGYVRRVQLLVTLPAYSPTDPPSVTLYFGRNGGALAALATKLPTESGVTVLEWQLPGDQVCNSFQFQVDLSAIGAGPIAHGLSLDVQAVGGLVDLPPGQRS
jgi:hypothetical protein